MADPCIFRAGNPMLQSGEVLEGAEIVYQSYGTLATDRSNAIIFLTPFGARHLDMEWMIGPDRALDPTKYFILIPNMMGNGLSSSPTSEPWASRKQFPRVTAYDNVQLQRRLLSEEFGIERVKLAVGWSMGGQQAYHWAALFPRQVERLVCLCGSARTSRHNFVFLEAVKAALTADPAYQEGWFTTTPIQGLKAVALAFASWALSQAFYREELDKTLGFSSLEEFLLKNWLEPFAQRNANNLLSMIWTWQHADISNNAMYHGNFEHALGSISSRALIMPSETDLYFHAGDSAREVALMPNAALRPIASIWGHRAGNNAQNPVDAMFVDQAIAEFLKE